MDDRIIGTPYEDATFFDGQQSYQDTCAIRCQEAIIQQFKGFDIDEHQLVQQAREMGIYVDGGGTRLEHVGELLEAYDIPCEQKFGANKHDLAMALAEGKKIIVGLDSGELLNNGYFEKYNEQLEDLCGASGADHAVVVCGIDTSDPNNIRVLLADPGTGESVIGYPIEQFLDAWQDSNFFMVSTCEPPPGTLPEMINFDYNAGHIPFIGPVSYEIFSECDQNEYCEHGFSVFEECNDTIETHEAPPDLINLETSKFSDDFQPKFDEEIVEFGNEGNSSDHENISNETIIESLSDLENALGETGGSIFNNLSEYENYVGTSANNLCETQIPEPLSEPSESFIQDSLAEEVQNMDEFEDDELFNTDSDTNSFLT
jgi:hypothetical protein